MNLPKHTLFATMGIYLAGILLQFNAANKLSLQELQTATLLPANELLDQAQILVERNLLISEVSIICENLAL